MDKYNLSSIGNYTTITLIKRAKYNRNICKTHKQLRFRIQHKKRRLMSSWYIIANYHQPSMKYYRSFLPYYLAIVYLSFVIWKKNIKNLKHGDCVRIDTCWPCFHKNIRSWPCVCRNSHAWWRLPQSALRNALLEIWKSIYTVSCN